MEMIDGQDGSEADKTAWMLCGGDAVEWRLNEVLSTCKKFLNKETNMTIKELSDQFNKLQNDGEKWKWVLNNQDKDIVVMLDNDYTYAVFTNTNTEEDDDTILYFDYYIGDSDGILILLEALGIKAEEV
jgi:hypothetical protein